MYGNGRFEADFSCGDTVKGLICDTGEAVFIKRWHTDNVRGKNERAISSEISHDAILGYTDVFVEDDMVYAVRKWIDAVTLSDILLKQKEISLTGTLDIMIKICMVLSDIRKKYGRFVHADIRPSNILFDEKSKNIFLIDFETFTFLDNSEVQKVTGLLERCGYTISPVMEGYIAPEVFRGEICEQSDVYSLGKVFSFLLGLCDYDGIFSHKNTLKFPRSIMKIIKKSTHTNIEKRQKNVGEMLDDLCYVFNSEIGVIGDKKEKTQKEFVESEIKSSLAVVSDKIIKLESKNSLPLNEIALPEKIEKCEKILYITGNTCFASELAFLIALRLKLKTVLFENGNRIGIGGFDYFIDCSSIASLSFVSEKKNPFFCDSRHLYLTDEEQWVLRGILSKSRYAENLYLSDCNVFSEFDIYGDTDLDLLFNWASDKFDITLICDDGEKSDELSVSMMKHADYIIIPVRPNIDEVYLAFKKYKQLCTQYGIGAERLIFVAWEYEDGISMPINDFKIAVDNFYGGFVPYDSERLKCKNIKGDFFCEKFADDIFFSYQSLLESLKLL